ncbi:hypothetical protein ACVWZZ_004745 [Bradyrhizobium sp. LM6.10]
MAKIKLLSKGLTNAEINAAVKLAITSGCAAEELEVVVEVGEPDPVCDDEIVLVVMTSAVCAAPDVEAELKKTPNGGRRVICLWPENAEAKQQPPAPVAKYAYSIIPWNSDKFSAVAADDDVMCFETPDGTTLPKVKMDHNECVEDVQEQAKPT